MQPGGPQHIADPAAGHPVRALAPVAQQGGQARDAQHQRRQHDMQIVKPVLDILPCGQRAGNGLIRPSGHRTAPSILSAAQRVARKPTTAAVTGISSGTSQPQP